MPRKIVLVVEDNKDSLAALSVLLERRGFTVLQAMTVQAGIQMGTHNTFDLLLCDIGLPDGDGTEVVQALRTLKPFPAIALTAHSTVADIERHLQAGFDLHVPKPYAFNELETAMKRLI